MTQSFWWAQPAPELSSSHQQQASERQNQLTKPPGSLGKLESIAIQLAAIQQQEQPNISTPYISIFAGDHGITEEGVSAFPQAVTVEMQRNFVNGGAAISVLAKTHNAHLEVINTGTHAEPESLPNVIHQPVAKQTQNFLHGDAMSESQWHQAIDIGKQAAIRAHNIGADLYIGGEMGIGNTTAATAILSVLNSIAVAEITGPGTGLQHKGVAQKIEILQKALAFHKNQLNGAQAISQKLGGFEIVALAGAYLHAAQLRMAVLVDGFICTAAAAVAMALNPTIKPYLFFSHCSAEPGHQRVVEKLGVDPILNLNLRLGEGSGAALVIPILQSACALHNHMATFAEAAVSGKKDS